MFDAKQVGGDEGPKATYQNVENGAAEWTTFSPQSAAEFSKKLASASWSGVGALKELLPHEHIVKIFEQASVLLKMEPTLVEVRSVVVYSTFSLVPDSTVSCRS